MNGLPPITAEDRGHVMGSPWVSTASKRETRYCERCGLSVTKDAENPNGYGRALEENCTAVKVA